MAWGFGSANHGSANAGTVSSQLAAANADRSYMNIMNDSDTAIYLNLGGTASPAVAGRGIRVNANGGAYEMSQDKGNIWTGAVQIISSADSKKVIYVEGVKTT